MKRTFVLATALTMGMAGLAFADSQPNIADAPQNPLAVPFERPQATYRFVDPGLPTTSPDNVAHAAGVSNVIYLNNCKPNGCQVTPGGDNALTNRSSIPDQASTVSPFAYSDAVWNQVVDCVRKTYAPFAVQIVTDRPASGNYHMAIVAGTPQNVQMQQGVGGVSPFSCGYIPNSISYSFANVYGGDVDQICWTVAQETAHSWGLDHKFDNRDPMTYLDAGPSWKQFQNMDGSCGEYSARACQCGGSTMNSYKEILQTFGGSTPTPPTVAITAPMNGDNVPMGFPIRANIMDDVSVSKAELRIDGNLVSTLNAAPWVWNAPASVGQGTHTIKVTGYDVSNTPADSSIAITIGAACKKPGDCASDTDTCVDGRCVAGEGVTGGLGVDCANNQECKSGQCGNDGTNGYCVENCNPDTNGCPSGFQCIASGASGVCWPGGGGDGGCNTSSDSGGVAFLGIGLGALLITRRRRR
jgi:MYXO-CTERM domain-containing protein